MILTSKNICTGNESIWIRKVFFNRKKNINSYYSKYGLIYRLSLKFYFALSFSTIYQYYRQAVIQNSKPLSKVHSPVTKRTKNESRMSVGNLRHIKLNKSQNRLKRKYENKMVIQLIISFFRGIHIQISLQIAILTMRRR